MTPTRRRRSGRRDRRRGRAQRSGRGHHPGPCRSLGPGLRGRGDARRRDPDRGADAPRVPPRRLLDDPAADPRLAVLPDRSTWPPAASSSSTRTRRSPTRSTAAGRPSSSGRCAATADGPRRGDGRAWRRLFGPLVRDVARARAGAPPAGRPSARGTRWRSPGSACRRSGRRMGWPALASATGQRGRCSPGSPPTRCSGSIAR